MRRWPPASNRTRATSAGPDLTPCGRFPRNGPKSNAISSRILPRGAAGAGEKELLHRGLGLCHFPMRTRTAKDSSTNLMKPLLLTNRCIAIQRNELLSCGNKQEPNWLSVAGRAWHRRYIHDCRDVMVVPKFKSRVSKFSSKLIVCVVTTKMQKKHAVGG